MINVEKGLANAVKHFWRTRTSQHAKQGSASGKKDAGNRAAVTGGKHADGFVNLIAEIVKDAELPNFEVLVHTAVRKHRTLPGYFRPCKEWTL
jgi:Restriction endonuclease XhoI